MMDLSSEQEDIFAIALVLESSLAVAQEWPRIYTEYVAHMISRLNETLPGHKARMAFISYASADVVPSPLLCRRFFEDPVELLREVNENPHKMGLGRTNSGEARGMAALDGLVAAIEFFEVMKSTTSTEQSPINVSHIFHIVASEADSAQHPRWNYDPLLDHVSWESLPAEFIKRNINYDLISLKPLPKFPEVHTSVSIALGKVAPWFQLRTNNTVLLSGFSAIDQQKVQNKRPVELPSSVQAPEPKKPRLGTPAEPSPKPQSKPTPQLASTLPPPANPPPAPIPPPQAQRTDQPQRPQIQRMILPPKEFQDRWTATEIALKKQEAEVQRLREAGMQHEADQMQADITEKRQKMGQVFALHQLAYRRLAQAQGQARVQAQAASDNASTSSGPVPLQPPSSLTKEPGPPTFDQAPPVPVMAPAAPLLPTTEGLPGTVPNTTAPPVPQRSSPSHARPSVTSNFNQAPNTQSPGLANASPQNPVPSQALAAQMAKLVEQQQRVGPTGSIQNATTSAVGAQPENHQAMGGPVRLPPQVVSVLGQGTGTLQQTPQNRQPIWSGVFLLDPRRDLRVFVQATPMSPNVDSRPDTWPKIIQLAPPSNPRVARLDFMEWAKRHHPVVCAFTPYQQGAPDPNKNAVHFAALAKQLCRFPDSIMYMSASWTLPSGAQEQVMLLFGMSTGAGMAGLYGAIFPLTGVPELPKPLTTPPGQVPQPQPLQLPPAIINQLSMLPPEQRNQIFQMLRRNPAALATWSQAAGQSQLQLPFNLAQSQVTQQSPQPAPQPQISQNPTASGNNLSMAGGPQIGGIGMPNLSGAGLNFMQAQQHQPGSQGPQSHDLMSTNHLFGLNAYQGGNVNYANLSNMMPTTNPMTNTGLSMGQVPLTGMPGLGNSAPGNGLQNARQYEMMQAFLQQRAAAEHNAQGMKPS